MAFLGIDVNDEVLRLVCVEDIGVVDNVVSEVEELDLDLSILVCLGGCAGNML